MNMWDGHRKIIEELPERENEPRRAKTTTRESSSPKVFAQKDFTIPETLQTKKKTGTQLQFLKRVSPFLLLEFFLLVLFPYMIITGTGFTQNKWLLLFLFIFIEINVLFTDFALWNYFNGKKIIRIWLIEVPLTFLIIHFLI
ncbi:MAG TPA: hypothetical protein VH396_03420 [Chitinophagaceae bacterium]|jgi:hypothetical protein